MARPRTFDDDAALDAAMGHFWRHGYAATSVRDLGEVMGLGPASLYNAFGDKRALFTRCLDRYLDTMTRERIARLEATRPPRAAVEEFIREVARHSLQDGRGCLLVNSALEVAPHDPELRALISDRLHDLELFFRGRLAAGQGDGSIATTHAPEDLARLLLAAVMGLRVLARSRPDRALIAGAVRQALALLDAPAAATRPGARLRVRPSSGGSGGRARPARAPSPRG